MKPTRQHIERVLQRERDLTPWVFSPVRDETERAQLERAIELSARRPQLQAELELAQIGTLPDPRRDLEMH